MWNFNFKNILIFDIKENDMKQIKVVLHSKVYSAIKYYVQSCNCMVRWLNHL